MIASYRFYSVMFERWTENTDIWLEMRVPRESISTDLNPEDLATTVTDGLLNSNEDDCPVLHLQVQYMNSESLNKITVEVDAHKTVVAHGQSFTIYCLQLKRADGVNWSVAVRYSKVFELREELIAVLPSLRAIHFPPKTYFHCLSVLCSSFSKFDLTRIERRKKGIEEFLAKSLENLETVQSEALTDLLNL